MTNDINSSIHNYSRPAEKHPPRRGNYFFGIIIITIGLLLLLSNMIPWFSFWSIFWPVFLIVIGLFIITGRRR